MEKVIKNLNKQLSNFGFKSTVVSINHLADLQSEMANIRHNNMFPEDFFDDRLSNFDFRLPRNLPTAKSIIITAAQQPKVIVKFTIKGQAFPVIVPPTYSYETDKIAKKIISDFLDEYQYTVCDTVLPVKTLAVHSGLAAYGKNNIAYIEGWGSFFRLRAFYSDLPCESTNWREYKMMDQCKKCTACIKSCPTKAIKEDRFMNYSERCLTHLNEGLKEFADWVDPKWHHCLIGCMVCQEVCPLNRNIKNMAEEGCEFTEDETEMFLRRIPRDRLPNETVLKLQKLYLLDDYDALKRNLQVLIN